MTDRVTCQHISGATRRRLERFRWHTLALCIAVGLALPGAAHAATTPYANTLDDLCPGTPNPCVVTKTFAIADGTVFDLGGRDFRLVGPTAQLLGDHGATIEFTNAGAVTLEKGSVIAALGYGGNGGSISITASGQCTVAGRVWTTAWAAGSGGEGGTVDLECADVQLDASAVIEANGAFDLGGSISISSEGGVGVAKGAKLRAKGGSGGGGGTVGILASGACGTDLVPFAINIEADGKQMNDPDFGLYGGDGGVVTISCDAGLLVAEGSKVIAGSVKTASGGEVTLNSGGDLTFAEHVKIQNDGFAPGLTDVYASGNLTLGKKAALTSTAKGDQSGDIHLEAGLACDLDGKLIAVGKADKSLGGAGGGGSVDVLCADITLRANAKVDASGDGFMDPGAGLVPGWGGTVNLAAGTGPVVALKRAKIKARSKRGSGGEVYVSSDQLLNIQKNASIDVSGSGGNVDEVGGVGGSISLQSSWNAVMIEGKLIANGVQSGGMIELYGIGITATVDSSVSANGYLGGYVTMDSTTAIGGTVGSVLIQKSVSAKGSGTGSTGGTVAIEACNVTVDTKGTISTDGTTGGSNGLTAHKDLTIAGKLSAKTAGTNDLVYRDEVSLPLPGNIVPASTATQDLTLSACL